MIILDEPTNHLDIESREALVEALTEYGGAVILVSHDPHLVELVADRLWLVKDGRGAAVRRRHGGLPPPAARPSAAARRSAPARRSRARPGRAPRRAATPRRCGPRWRSARRGSRSSRRCARRSTGRLANPLLYARGDTEEIETLQKKRAEVQDGLARAEALWLAALERLEAAGAALMLELAGPRLRHALRHHRPDRPGAALRRADPGHGPPRQRERVGAAGARSSPSRCSPPSACSARRLLTAIGISMPAFRISGGLLLFLTALDMLFERRTDRRERRATDERRPTPRSFRWRCR